MTNRRETPPNSNNLVKHLQRRGTPTTSATEKVQNAMTGVWPVEPIHDGKYARIERERRFLLAGPPPPSAITGRRRINDRYLPETRLRLRRIDHMDSGECEFKFTQKVPADQPGFIQGLITNTYLSAAEYDLLASLRADVLSKTRLSVPPLSIDIFDPPLHGLIMADVEFSTDKEAQAFLPPSVLVAEVTDDLRFTGGSLVRARRDDLLAWLAEYGIEPQQPD
jgi:CYTH domain-containing protein